jgi:diguanylate cyclase (GGDEF)-like protein
MTETIAPEIVPENIEQEINALDWRDLQLWYIGFAVLVVVAAGFVAIIMPQVLWQVSSAVASQQYVVQLILGLTALLVLLNIYLFQQRLILLRTRRKLIVQLQIAERRARTDALTGVFNRRFMEEALTREIAQAERYRRKLSVMIIDIDGFKEFNTQLGHLMGDHILVEVAALLRKNFRAADLVIRYGGDEFLVIMPDTDLIQAGAAGQRLRWWLERWNGSENREYQLSLSCGVALYVPGTTIRDLIEAADADLYVQKASRTQLSGEPLETPAMKEGTAVQSHSSAFPVKPEPTT